VVGIDDLVIVEICECAGDPPDPGRAAAGQPPEAARIEPRRVRVARERDERAQRAGWNMRVASPVGSRESCSLSIDCRAHTRTCLLGRFADFGTGRLDLEPQIEAVEERCRKPPRVPHALGIATSTRHLRSPARARVGARDEQKVGRELQRSRCPADADDAFLERLPQPFEHADRELGQLVEKERSSMPEGV